MKYLKTAKQRTTVFWTVLPGGYIIFLAWLISIKFVAIMAAILGGAIALGFGVAKLYEWCKAGDK